MTEKKLYWWVKLLVVFGVLLAIYLMYEQVTQPAWQPCRINSTVNCDAVVSGAVKNTLGIPTPIYGLVGYIFIFLGVMWKNKKLIMGMATFGLLFCAYIAYRELFQLHVICPVCIGCQLDMIATFTLGILLLRKKLGVGEEK
jgi:uncharacterized membrane protein